MRRIAMLGAVFCGRDFDAHPADRDPWLRRRIRRMTRRRRTTFGIGFELRLAAAATEIIGPAAPLRAVFGGRRIDAHSADGILRRAGGSERFRLIRRDVNVIMRRVRVSRIAAPALGFRSMGHELLPDTLAGYIALSSHVP